MMRQQEVAARILGTDDSVEAMNLGKAINSDNPQWKNSAEEVMQKALDIKFANPPFKLALQKTEKLIGEATRHPVWGTGNTMGHRDAFNTSSWTGKNTLGLLLAKTKDIELVRCHRIGRQYPQGRRPILVRFRFFEDKEMVMMKRSNLRGSGVYLNEDLCLDSKRKQASLIPILKELKKIEVKTNFRGDKLAFRGRLFDENNIIIQPPY